MFSYRFGSNIINFLHLGDIDKVLSSCYIPCISFADKSEFDHTNKKIVIGGKPLTIKKYKGKIDNPYSKNPSIPNYFIPYSIESIYINNIIPIDTSIPENTLFVLDGIRLLSLKSNSYKNYLMINHIDYSPIFYDQTIFKGIPLCIGKQRELIFINSDYKENDIEEYSSLYIGGSPLSVGRVSNNWYLLVSENYNMDSNEPDVPELPDEPDVTDVPDVPDEPELPPF